MSVSITDTAKVWVEPMRYHGPGYTVTFQHTDCETYAQVWLPQTPEDVSPSARIRNADGDMVPVSPRSAYAASWVTTCGESDHQDGGYIADVPLDEALDLFGDPLLGSLGPALKTAFAEAIAGPPG